MKKSVSTLLAFTLVTGVCSSAGLARAQDQFSITGSVQGDDLIVQNEHSGEGGSLQLRMRAKNSRLLFKSRADHADTEIYQSGKNRSLELLVDTDRTTKKIFAGSCISPTHSTVRTSEIRGLNHVVHCANP